jgi:hypothetical protein
MSTGFVTSSRMASGESSSSAGTSVRHISTFTAASFSRVWPGFCLAPAVITTMSESAVTATSSEPITFAVG